MRLSDQPSDILRRILNNQMILIGADVSDLAAGLGIPSSSLDRILKTKTSWSVKRARAAADWLARQYAADPQRVFEEIVQVANPTLPFLRELRHCAWLIPDESSIATRVKRLVEIRQGHHVLRLSTLLPPTDMLISEVRKRVFDSKCVLPHFQADIQRNLVFRFGSLTQRHYMTDQETLPAEQCFIWPMEVQTLISGPRFPFDPRTAHLIDELREFWRFDCIANRRMVLKLLPETSVGGSILRRFEDFAEVELINDNILLRRLSGRAVWQLFDARDGNQATQSIVNNAAQILHLACDVSQPMELETIRRQRA